jgi:hypothetical protein
MAGLDAQAETYNSNMDGAIVHGKAQGRAREGI